MDEFNTLEYYNSYDDLNEFFVNSYELDTETPDVNMPKKGIQIVSDKDQIRFVHEDDASDRHKQIHTETDKPSKTKATTANTKKSTNDKFAKKKAEIRERMNTKSKEQAIKDVLDSIDITYTTNKYKSSKSTTSSYSSSKSKTATTQKKSSAGAIVGLVISILLLFGPMLISIFEFVADELDTEVPSFVYDMLDEDEDEEDYSEDFEPELYTGDTATLIKIYEISDPNNEHPYYYDEDGILYDSNYYTVEKDCEEYNFTKEDIANIRVCEYKSNYRSDDNFVDAFIDEKTHIAYYILDGIIYDANNEVVDENDVALPPETRIKLAEYNYNH